jgi:hypothetical protein
MNLNTVSLSLAGSLLTLALGFAASLPAMADEGARLGGPVPQTYRQECATCHIAYPRQLLPIASWKHILDNLPRHFGTDASLDPVTVQALSAWLLATQRRDVMPQSPEDRITRSAWFVREHRSVPGATWKMPAVRSAANCAACHTRANEGDFNEHQIVLPR